MPAVSIIMPSYNAEGSVLRTIAAVLGQTFEDFELLVCDDGSTDNTRMLVSAVEDERVKLRSGSHMGVSYARNKGLEYARGTYVAFVDADDLPHQDWLEQLVGGMGEGISLSVGGYDVVDEEGTRLYGTAHCPEDATFSAQQMLVSLFSNDLMYQGYVWNKLFRRDVIECEVEFVEGAVDTHRLSDPVRFHRGIAYNEDRLFLFYYLLRCGKVHFASRPCYDYLAHGGLEGYAPVMATELVAFEEMLDVMSDIQVAEGPRIDTLWDQVTFFLEKDCFRATVELFARAHSAGDTDALWMGERLRDLAFYAGEFGDYPPAFNEKIARVLVEAGA